MCKLKVRYGEIEFEAEGTPEFIEAERTVFQDNLRETMALMASTQNFVKSKFIQAETVLPETSHTLIETVANDTQKYSSLSQYLRSKNFSSDTDRVLGVACYLFHNENKKNFSANCIKTALKDARQNIPTNINACINQNINVGRIVEDKENKIDSKKAYYITQDGIDYCNNFIAKENNSSKTNKSKSKKPKATSITPVCEVNIDSLNCDKYCDITKLEKLNDQIRVLMYMYTKETDFEEFTVKEIEYILTTRFKIAATTRQVKYYFEKAGTEVHSTLTGHGKQYKYKLLNNGLKAAESIINNTKE